MKRYFYAWLIVMTSAAIAAGQVSDGRTPLANNAALQYWQAFSQLPALGDEYEKLFESPTGAALKEPKAEKLLSSSQQSFLYLQRAAACDACDWGLDYNDGVGLLLPHLAKGRDLGRLAALEARRSFEQGNYQAARAKLQEIMVLGRYVARDPILIAILVGSGVEGMAIDAAAPYIPDWKPPYAEVAAMFQKLPKAPTFEQSVALEKQYMARWIIDKLEAESKRSRDGWRDLWKMLFLGSESQPPAVESAEEAAKLVRDLLPVYDELPRFVALPRDQFQAEYPAFKQRTKEKYPLAGLLLPALDKVRDKLFRQEARRQMMLAAVAYVEGGAAKLTTVQDPFGTGPFEYRALDKGFELKSKLIFEGQSVTLTVGQR